MKNITLNHTLQIEWERTSIDLLHGLASIKREDFDRIPFKGNWTAGQLAEHLDKAIGPEVLLGQVHHTERNPDEKVEAIVAVFLNFDIKMRSPHFIRPTETVISQNTQIDWEISRTGYVERDRLFRTGHPCIPAFRHSINVL